MEEKLKYPVLLVHGMGFRDRKVFCYWGRIPKLLEDMGCKVFFGHQDATADIAANGAHLAKRIDEILEETGAERVNIIAHSKGGLDSRYAISSLGMGSKVATLTTIATPHNGSKTMDHLMKIPQFLVKTGCFFTDFWFRLLGDKRPRTYKTLCSFTTMPAQEFNRENPDDPQVYYQSYAFVMQKPSSDMILWLANRVVRHYEGENDGLLPPESVKWGHFRGTLRGVGKRGVSHFDEIDFRRKPLSKVKGDGVADILDFYTGIVEELAQKGC